jgi:hypothetical protein
MIREDSLEGAVKNLPWHNLRYYTGFCVEELRKSTNTSVRIAGVRTRI